MKRTLFPCLSGLLFLMTLVAAVSSCGPSTYALDIELRQPSRSGLELGGKSLSVVFVDNGVREDSLFICAVAESFADRLDKEYFGGDSLVGVFRVPSQGADWSNRDSVINILMETGSDVLFLFDRPEFGQPVLSGVEEGLKSGDSQYAVSGKFPCKISLYAYDSMDKSDKVRNFHGSETAEAFVYAKGSRSREELAGELKENLVPAARNMGKQSGAMFLSQWKKETFYFYVYDSEQWYESAYAVYDYEWKKAMDIWLAMLDTKNMQKRACIEYNLALACYMTGSYDLALKWIELSAKDFDLPYTSSVKRKIEIKSQK